MPVDQTMVLGAQEEGPENFESRMKLWQEYTMLRVFQIDARYKPSCFFRTVRMPLGEACKHIAAWICASELDLLTMDASASNITVVMMGHKNDWHESLGENLVA